MSKERFNTRLLIAVVLLFLVLTWAAFIKLGLWVFHFI